VSDHAEFINECQKRAPSGQRAAEAQFLWISAISLGDPVYAGVGRLAYFEECEMDEKLHQLLSDLNAETPKVRAAFDDLFDPTLDTIPIPFFGDVLNAKVITVGLNPSDGEIRGRGWHQPISPSSIYERLLHYFNHPQFRAHPWFNTWEQALSHIGVSYVNGTAAHVDLCPWATRPMSNLPDRFALLVSQSLPSFWRCMQTVRNLRLVLMAGAVTNKYYMNEFLAKERNLDGHELIGKVARDGRAFVGYHQMRLSGRLFPVFFCSVSPSYKRNAARLPERVRENRDRLAKFLV
jgi:hypothetical protein